MCKVNVISAEVSPRLRLQLIASEDISPGDVIVQCTPEELQCERTWRTLQVGCSRHVRNEFLNFVDHSCDPNALLDTDAIALVAIRKINAGDPVTFFYPGSEVELAQEFVCNCGSAQCLGHIKGAFYLTHDQMQWAMDAGFCTAFMRREFSRLIGQRAA